jgi:hypothetical protein
MIVPGPVGDVVGTVVVGHVPVVVSVGAVVVVPVVDVVGFGFGGVQAPPGFGATLIVDS